MILQKYDFSSKSQLLTGKRNISLSCLWYCKSTIFQANHNRFGLPPPLYKLFVILQKYDFSSKSQHHSIMRLFSQSCLWYCKSTIFQANHNPGRIPIAVRRAVCDTAKVRFFKQITTYTSVVRLYSGCLWYCKSTIFQANHNYFFGLE